MCPREIFQILAEILEMSFSAENTQKISIKIKTYVQFMLGHRFMTFSEHATHFLRQKKIQL